MKLYQLQFQTHALKGLELEKTRELMVKTHAMTITLSSPNWKTKLVPTVEKSTRTAV